jgi:hypothetical protein
MKYYSINKNILQDDLQVLKKLAYDKCGFSLTDMKWNAESIDYGACSFVINKLHVEHRLARTTPKKNGQFVTIWKRNEIGITEPFSLADNIDLMIITVETSDRLGQFVFPMPVLASKGIIIENGKGGKRGIRVYPPWVAVESKQAEKTQNWQMGYFLEIKCDGTTDLALLKKLYESDQVREPHSSGS